MVTLNRDEPENTAKPPYHTSSCTWISVTAEGHLQYLNDGCLGRQDEVGLLQRELRASPAWRYILKRVWDSQADGQTLSIGTFHTSHFYPERRKRVIRKYWTGVKDTNVDVLRRDGEHTDVHLPGTSRAGWRLVGRSLKREVMSKHCPAAELPFPLLCKWVFTSVFTGIQTAPPILGDNWTAFE